MAVRKYLLKHYNETTKEDSSIHLQTSSDIVLRPDGSSVEDALNSVTSNVDKLTSDSGEGSIKQAVADGISSIVAGAPESLDTLKEMSDWIQTHENDASAMNSRITKNTNDIATLSEDVADTAATVNANNVKITNLQSTVNSATANIDDKLGKSETAIAATKLATTRTVRTNLGSTSTASFDGTANITPGVTGVLPVANGGTGVSTLSALSAAIVGANALAKPANINTATLGSTITWAGLNWVIGYKSPHMAILVLKTTDDTCSMITLEMMCAELSQASDIGIRSILDIYCAKFAADHDICNTDYIININSNLPIFIPTYRQYTALNIHSTISTLIESVYAPLYGAVYTDRVHSSIDMKTITHAGVNYYYGYGGSAYCPDIDIYGFSNGWVGSMAKSTLGVSVTISVGTIRSVNYTVTNKAILALRPFVAIRI